MKNIIMTTCKSQDTSLCASEVNPNLLQEYWLQLRCTGPDVFNIIKYTNDGQAINLQNGWMPQGKETIQDLKSLLVRACNLKKNLNNNSKEAANKIHTVNDFAEYTDIQDKNYCIFCKCSDGIIGVGWRMNDGDQLKAKLLAGFTLYCLGLMSGDNDPVLWEVAYRHLPFAINLDLGVADKLFVKYMIG